MTQNKTILLFIYFIIGIGLYANANKQKKTTDPVLDSLISIINNDNIPFREKYLLDSIVRKTQSLRKYRNVICLQVIAKAKKEKAYDKLFRLYANSAAYYTVIGENLQARLYLDSAKLYHNENYDPVDLAYYNSEEGRYYGGLRQYDIAHKYFYNAIEYYEKTKNNYGDIIHMLRNMSIVHFNKHNYQEVRKILDKMKLVPQTGKDSVYIKMRIDEVAGGYYEDLSRHGKNIAFLDSAQTYYKEAIDMYESLDSIQRVKYNWTIFFIYTKSAEIEIDKPDTNWKFVRKYANQARNVSSPTSSLQLSILHVLDAMIFMKNQQYNKAEASLDKAKEIVDVISVKVPEYKNQFNDIYRKYIDLYKMKGDYKNALKYVELENKLRSDFLQETNNQIIKELDTKYETLQKDLKIKELHLEKQEKEQNQIIIVAISLLVVILLTISLLYNRIQRLKKEKEASVLLNRIKEKDTDFLIAANKAELKSIRSYLNGLEAERERLAKELHDNVANELLSIDVQLKQGGEVAKNILSQIENLHGEIRNISHELMPPLFRYASLPEIISDYIAKINERKDIQMELDIENEYVFEDIPNKTLLEVYRIVQETTSNIIKHSKATKAEVALKCTDNMIMLRIEDDGQGFNPSMKQNGIGLLIVRERVHSLNGTIEVESSKGSGCRIHIKLPISPISQQDDNQ